MKITKSPVFIRSQKEQIGLTDIQKNNREINRKCFDDTAVIDTMKRNQELYRGISENIKGTDRFFYPVVFIRTVQETQNTTDSFSKLGNYIRCLYIEAGSMAETVRWGNYYRTESETVQAEGSVFRHFFIFVKIITVSLVRDFVLRRFLVAREELVLKSCVTKEFTLESKIN
jgi:hypothetical protein